MSCANASHCIAVGHFYGVYCYPGAEPICQCYKYGGCVTVNRALVESWNGRGWSVESAPSMGYLLDGSCTSTACSAVGYNGNGTLAMQSINGGGWAIQSTPSPAGATRSSLASVSCLSSSACTAVGQYVNGSGTEATLAEAWNGTTWTIQSTPDP